MLRRPDPSEYDDYYALYVDQVGDGPILDLLESELARTKALLEGTPPEAETRRYADGKWSVREVLGHVLDVERTFGYRALFIARGDPGELPSYDQEVWSDGSNHGGRLLAEILVELESVRRGHVHMFRSFSDEAWLRRGIASGLEFSARSFPWIIVGHEIHHRTLLEERYRLGGAW